MLWLPIREQERVSRVAELDRGGVPGTPDHQLGCDPVGQKTLRVVGCSSYLGYGVVNRGFAACLSRLQGKCLATAPILPFHSGISQHDPVHNHVTISTNEKSLHSGVPKLLVGKALFGKHVQRSTPSNAKVPIGIKSTVDDS